MIGEPEQLQAFRDTWELGIHSYLSYLRDRLLLARELLHETGTCFMQIGDENVHRVAILMDEVFGAENRIATISFATTGSSSTSMLPEICDYLLVYARDKKQVKYRQLYEKLDRSEIVESFSSYAGVELKDGMIRNLSPEERYDPNKFLPEGAKIFKRITPYSQGESKTGRSESYFWNGREFPCPSGQHWSVSMEGLNQLAEQGRLYAIKTSTNLFWKKYESEHPGREINNLWAKQMRALGKRYVVETNKEVIQRCLLMSTDPGDLVLDITCGSGTTSVVAEQWGRRWITCDTSRVAIVLAKERLLTATYRYYQLARPDEGVGSGFVYKTMPKVSAATLAYNEKPEPICLYDQPEEDRSRNRVTGPFTVEAVPAATVTPIDELLDRKDSEADASIARSGETIRQSDLREELSKTGIRGKGGQSIDFARLESLPGGKFLHAIGETKATMSEDSECSGLKAQNIVVSFGPKHAPLDAKQVELAIQEAENLRPSPDIVVFAAFQFDPEAAKDINETNWPGVTLLTAHTNIDLLTEDLKKKRSSNESFWLIGQPDVVVEKLADGEHVGKYQVSVQGFDYYNVANGALESGGADRIAMWTLDTDYDGRSVVARQIFFPMGGRKGGWNRLAESLGAAIDKDLIKQFAGTKSLPFEAGDFERVAIKIVDDRGIESLKIVALDGS